MSHFVVTVLVNRPEGYDPAQHRTISHNGITHEVMEQKREAGAGVGSFFADYAEATLKQQIALAQRPDLVKQIEAEVDRLLAPYDESTEVEEYDRECHCIGDVARRDAREAAAKAAGVANFGALRDSFKREPVPEGLSARAYPRDGSEGDPEAIELVQAIHARNDAAWEQHIAIYLAAEEAALAAHPARTLPDPGCGFYTGERKDWWPADKNAGDRYEDGSGCGGTGLYRSQYNPKSQWDWYVIGGRWDGLISGNMAPVEEVLPRLGLEDKSKRFSTYAILTPDGEWHQKGEMGWFGVSTGEVAQETWDVETRRLLEAHPDCIAVVVDAHI